MTGLTLSPSQLVQAVPDRYSHLWQRIGDVLRLIQPSAPLESNMQRDMQWDVTCCTVTSASLLAILCLASGRSEDTRFTDMSMEQHQLLIQRNEGRFTLFLFQQHQRLGNSRAPCDDPHGRLTDTALRCVLYKEGTPCPVNRFAIRWKTT